MFTFFKNWFQKHQKERKARLNPEAAFVVVVSDDEIANNRPDGKVEKVAFKDLKEVIIETNDSGPWGADVWWIYVGNGPESGCVFPGGATGEQVALAAVQKLPGFDNEAFVKAMSSTSNQRFLCWKSIP